MWTAVWLPAAERERDKLPATERAAIYNAIRKLQALGPGLPYPHSSAVAGADRLRELRPRQGRSPWRLLYRQVAGKLVVAAVAPQRPKTRADSGEPVRRLRNGWRNWRRTELW